MKKISENIVELLNLEKKFENSEIEFFKILESEKILKDYKLKNIYQCESCGIYISIVEIDKKSNDFYNCFNLYQNFYTAKLFFLISGKIEICYYNENNVLDLKELNNWNKILLLNYDIAHLAKIKTLENNTKILILEIKSKF